MIMRTRMVKINGARLPRVTHRAWNSSLLFFFITIALRNGDINNRVTAPTMICAHCS